LKKLRSEFRETKQSIESQRKEIHSKTSRALPWDPHELLDTVLSCEFITAKAQAGKISRTHKGPGTVSLPTQVKGLRSILHVKALYNKIAEN
jgi:hypothetical protein